MTSEPGARKLLVVEKLVPEEGSEPLTGGKAHGILSPILRSSADPDWSTTYRNH